MGLLAVCLLALAAAASAGSPCREVPTVNGVDQSPSDPNMYGKCSSAIESHLIPQSHWCRNGKMGSWPTWPTNRAKQCMKFGRASIYRGPVYGSSPQHLAACNKVLRGDNDYAMVAVSTKYLKTYQGGWAGDKGACDRCMCVRMHGGDDDYNKGIQKENARKHLGLTFLAKVGDRCSECPDDHIDILQDRPFSWAPFDPSNRQNNQWAPYVNAKDGYRGFRDPDAMRGTAISPENVGTWTADWQWVPCQQFSHDKCAGLMRSMGYNNVWTPSWESGIDSYSLRPVSTLRSSKDLLKEPWS